MYTNDGNTIPLMQEDGSIPSQQLLSKRELIAAMAMQALLSDTATMANISKDARSKEVSAVKYLVSASCKYADHLIAELERTA